MIANILNKAVAGERITPEEGCELIESHELAAIGRAADEISRRLHPEPYRTYNIDRNINYTNICTAVCDFCAFFRTPKSPEGYVLPREELLNKIEETVALGGNQILMQGGLHPDYKLDWYEQLLHDIKSRFPRDLVVVSPDAGGTERARAFAKRLNAGLAIIDKRRSAANVSEVMHIIGEVDGQTCIIVDDMIDTAGTLCQAAAALKAHGAADIYATATHAVLSGPALERINASPLKEVLVCNTIPTEKKINDCSRLRIVSVANLLAEAIRRIHGDESVSSLFV